MVPGSRRNAPEDSKADNIVSISTRRGFLLDREPIELDKLAASRWCLPPSQLSVEVQKIYQSYKESLERVEADRPHPPGFPVLVRLAHLLALGTLWLQLAFFAAITIVWLRP